MEHITTASWIETWTRWDDDVEFSYSSQHWLRMSPPAQARRSENESSWSHDVTDDRGHLTTASTWNICHLYPHRKLHDASSLEFYVRFKPEPSNGSQPRPYLNWMHQQAELEGAQVNQWRREYIDGNFKVVDIVWTELETNRILRKECWEMRPQTDRIIQLRINDHYAYNVDLPEGIFEMPAGKPIVTRDIETTMPEVWDTLPARDRQAIQTLIDRSDDAWRRSDFDAFASLWIFESVRLVPSAEEWRRRVQYQHGLWSRWSSTVNSARSQHFIMVTVARNCTKWGPEKRKVLAVRVGLTVANNQGSVGWTGHAEFHVRRVGRGYRIVHWEYPYEQIRSSLTPKST